MFLLKLQGRIIRDECEGGTCLLAESVGQFECYFATFLNISSLIFLPYFYFFLSSIRPLIPDFSAVFFFPLLISSFSFSFISALFLYLLLTFLVFSFLYFSCLFCFLSVYLSNCTICIAQTKGHEDTIKSSFHTKQGTVTKKEKYSIAPVRISTRMVVFTTSSVQAGS